MVCWHGCLESVEWNAEMEHWNGILEWNTGIEYRLIISIAEQI